MDLAENWPLTNFWLKSAAPTTGGLWLLISPKKATFKVKFSPIAEKGVESIIESRIVALMKATAPQI